MTTQTTAPADRPATTGEPPGRGSRAPLRVLAVGLSLLLVAYGAVVLASLLSRETRTSSASYDGIRTVQLDTSFESVEVLGADGARSVDVKRRWRWSTKEPTVHTRRVGDRLIVSSSCTWSPGLPCTGHVRINVPTGTTVIGGSGDGHLLVSGTSGRLDLHNADGGIELDAIRGRVRLSTSDGSVRATNLFTGRAVVDTSDGSVDLRFAVQPSALRVSTVDGSVQVAVPADGTAYDVSVSTSDGSRQVDVPTDPGSAHKITVHTSDGSVRILPAG